MNILVFAPHPDDDILGCGGSIAKYIKKGCTVTVVYMTAGDAGDLQYSKSELTLLRKKEVAKAGGILGIKEHIFLAIPDGEIEFTSKTLASLVELLRKYQPEVVYMPHATDGHRDHANTFTLVNEAVRRASANAYQEYPGKPWFVPTVLSYEVWTPLQEPNYVEDITEVIDIKIAALKEHASQLRNVAYDAAIQGLNRYRGAMTGKGTYCECFQVIRVGKILPLE